MRRLFILTHMNKSFHETGISKAMTVVKRAVYLSLAIDNKLGNYSAAASLKSAILRAEGYNIWVVSGVCVNQRKNAIWLEAESSTPVASA